MASLLVHTKLAEARKKLELLISEEGFWDDLLQLRRKLFTITDVVNNTVEIEVHHEDSNNLWPYELNDVVNTANNLLDEVEDEIIQAKIKIDLYHESTGSERSSLESQPYQPKVRHEQGLPCAMETVSLNTGMAELLDKLEHLQVKSGVIEDLKQLQTKSSRIQALVEDADQMTIYDKTTKLWLAELSGIASEAQDVVDELEYEIVNTQVNITQLEQQYNDSDAVESTLMKTDLDLESYSSTRHANLSLFLTDIIAPRVKKIIEKYDDISKSRQYLRLTFEDGTIRPDCHSNYPLSTSHMVKTSEVYGRNDDKKNILRWLFSDTSSNSSNSSSMDVLSIVGKGGIGKTTIAQLVYNDCEVTEFFDQKIWICVSLYFDVVKLTRQMVEAVTMKPCFYKQLDILHEMLHGKLAGQKVLLVLDDVWNLKRSLWESFKTPLDNGKQLIKIIVTTRSRAISSMIEGTTLYHLDYLHNNECWELFKSRAFCGRNSKDFRHLEDIGMRITIKCAGLPLAVKSLGSIPQNSIDEERWNDILESRLWELEEENEILPILRLSYDYLPSYLKPCFLSCIVFPKDYHLKKDELVHLWIALGYIQSNITRNLEEIGNAYFDELYKKSFFDHGESYRHLEIFKMHDIIHDLAVHVSHYGFGEPSSNSSRSVQGMTSLHALVYNYWESFLPVTHNIKHLRYLVLNNISMLPKDLCHLYNLRVLVIVRSSSSYTNLSLHIGNLINLIYLRVYTVNRVRLPISASIIDGIFGMSRYLGRQCSTFCYGQLPPKLERLYLNADNLSIGAIIVLIGELKKLVNLRGTLCISNIKDMYVEDAKELNLKNKPQLEDLRLSWGSYPCGSEGYNHLHLMIPVTHYDNCQLNIDEFVFNSLQPHSNIRNLTVKCYGGVRYPSWVGDPSFIRLNKIHLLESKVSRLPTLGQLPLLQYLVIRGFSNLKSVGCEFCRNSHGLSEDEKVAFPSLLNLEFYDMVEWNEWGGVQDQDFPKLQNLVTFYCPFLILPVQLQKF